MFSIRQLFSKKTSHTPADIQQKAQQNKKPADNNNQQGTTCSDTRDNTNIQQVSSQNKIKDSNNFCFHIKDKPLALDPDKIAIIRQQYKNASKYDLTENQWQMALTTNNNTLVNAGAGSGKSTTLVMRALVLHLAGGIPLESIIIFSFTRLSVAEFRSKLIATFSIFDIEVSEKQAEKMVRTFHSKVYEQARHTISAGKSNIFEFIGSGCSTEKDMKDKLDNMTSPSTLSYEQHDIIKLVYRNLFKKNQPFRDLIKHLFKMQLNKLKISLQKEDKEYSKFSVEQAVRRDQQLNEIVNEIFHIQGAKTGLFSKKLEGSDFSDFSLQANARIPGSGELIFFMPDQNTCAGFRDIKIDNFNINSAITMKKRILALYSSDDIRVITNHLEARMLAMEIEFGLNNPSPDTRCPVFPIELSGESKKVLVWEALYQQGMFIESAGLEVQDIQKADMEKLCTSDKLFSKALVIFWQEFQQHLKDKEIMRFHDMFQQLSGNNFSRGYLRPTAEKSLESMQHILVDEFQDISPETVKWIQTTITANQHRGKGTSLMCVGDDFQSIYGWRGSSADYFIDYSTHFPSRSPQQILMTENFRSNQEIINTAELLLKPITYKTRKHGISKTEDCNNAFTWVTKNTFDEKLLHEEITNILEIIAAEIERDETIFVLARSNKKLNAAKKILGKQGKTAQFHTFHCSKGLEADYCILLDDCCYQGGHDFRNMVYEQTDFSQTYDQAQDDEARRLAYVAVTRAKKKCWWIGEAQDGGAMESLNEKNQLPKAA